MSHIDFPFHFDDRGRTGLGEGERLGDAIDEPFRVRIERAADQLFGNRHPASAEMGPGFGDAIQKLPMKGKPEES